MGFGSFNILILLFGLLTGNNLLHGQQQTSTANYLYKQLDVFLEAPSPTTLIAFNHLIKEKEQDLHTNQDQLAWVIVHCNLGYYQNQFGNFTQAINDYERAWDIFQTNKLANYNIVQNCLQPLGNTYLKIGDLIQAEKVITNYLFMAEQSGDDRMIISGITNLSIVYNNQRDYKKAIQLLQEGLNIDSNNINLLNNLATNHLDIQNYIKAKEIAERILDIAPKQVNAYQILSAISLSKKDYENAEKYMQKAVVILTEDANTSSRDIAKLHLAHTDILIKQYAYTTAELYIKKIYSALLPNYKTENDLPKEEDLIADRVLLNTLDLNAYILKQSEKPSQAINAYELAFKVNLKLNELYPLQNTKILQHTQQRNRTENYIELLFELFQNSGNNIYLNKAFQAAEQSKAPFVTQALISKDIFSSYRNDPLIKQKETISLGLSYLETQILKEKQKGAQANITNIQKWSVNHHTQSLALKEIIHQLKSKYPLLTKSNQQVLIKDVQKKMISDNSDVFIEYFYGNKFVYKFEIYQDSFRLEKIGSRKELDGVILPFIQLFDNPSIITNNIPSYTELAYDIFKQLQFPDKKNHILMIPDGLLSFIPFEALLTETTNSLNFENMPFVLKSTKVSYEISADKYIHSSTSEHKKQTVLGLFPVFESSSLELPHSKQENALIQQYVNGKFLINKQATYQNLLKNAQNHTIIHLSTHAESGNFIKPASIKFADQDILVTQLYGLSLTTDLVVLSACETGVGLLAKGEGPLSIGRAFQYAGVPNVLFSLWKVNDKSTSLLMGNFYKNLDLSNANALHQSKLDYLTNSNISNFQKSPYHWASFVYYGDLTPRTSLTIIWRYLIIALCIVFILLLSRLHSHKT